MSDIKDTKSGVEYRITDEGIEFGADPIYDFNYSCSYCFRFTIDELEELLEVAKRTGPQ